MFAQSDLPQITWSWSQEELFYWLAKVENQKGVETRNIFVWSYKVIYLLVISCYTTQSVLKVVYNSIIYPYLNYSILSMGRASNANIQPLIKLQNKAIKIIRTTSTASLEEPFQNLNILCLPKLYALSVLFFIQRNKILGTWIGSLKHLRKPGLLCK